MPGPREDIVPAALITRYHGIGGFTFGGRNLSATIDIIHFALYAWSLKYNTNLGLHDVSGWAFQLILQYDLVSGTEYERLRLMKDSTGIP